MIVSKASDHTKKVQRYYYMGIDTEEVNYPSLNPNWFEGGACKSSS